MKLWLISQEQNNGWDTYDSAVVAADTEEAAARTLPDGRGSWSETGQLLDKSGQPLLWPEWATDLSEVKVKYLGEAAEGIEPGVVLASYNAG